MLTIYKWENGGLKEASEFASSCWINLVDPTTTELESVLTHSNVPRDFLTDPLDAGERPRFDYEDDCIMKSAGVSRNSAKQRSCRASSSGVGVAISCPSAS